MFKNKVEIWCVEVNLDDDVSSALAWHVDVIDKVLQINLTKAEKCIKSNGWVVVGLANSQEDACNMSKVLREMLCKKLDRIPKGIHEIIEEIYRS